MIDELVINSRFGRWAVGKLLRKTLKSKAGIEGDVVIKKLNVRSDEATAAVDIEMRVVMRRADAEKLIKQALKEDS